MGRIIVGHTVAAQATSQKACLCCSLPYDWCRMASSWEKVIVGFDAQLSSGQLFVAAGLMTVPLAPLTAAFLVGRLVSYSIYVSAGTIAAHSLGSVALDALTSPLGMALQLLMLAGLAILAGGIGPRRRGDLRDGSLAFPR